MKSLLASATRWPKSAATANHVALGGVRWRSKARSRSRPAPSFAASSINHSSGRAVLRDHFDGEAPVKKSTRSSPVSKRNFELFEVLVNRRLNAVVEDMGQYIDHPEEYRCFGVTNQAQLDRELGLFKKAIEKAFALATASGKVGRQDNPIFWNLRNAFVKADNKGLHNELKHAFQTFLMRDRFPEAITELHRGLADLRFPYEWYPATRQMQRTIHLHVGPTNSGKTYHALKALENAKSGIYAGPLRLLAHEIWTRFTAKDIPCALVTGEEIRIPKDADRWFHSCTVEMSPLNRQVDVAVIDEIQMIGDDERGWAWTQAVLGIQAKEVHLCGEDRVVDLIKDLCARIGDKCEVHRYERLNPLVTMNKPLGDLRNLEKGDAVVAFSRKELHKLKSGIEQQTGRRCAIVYGSLPPETRAAQAALFNDPNNDYDYLCASDAIGMGLNLEIKRVIFESSSKYDGMAHRQLQIPEIKQIGGRAGRYKTASAEISSANSAGGVGDTQATEAPRSPTPGYVTALERDDLEIIQQGFKTDAKSIETAGVFPPASIIEQFHTYFPPRTPTAFVLSRLRELARLSPRFHMCVFQVPIQIAESIQQYDLSVSDRCVFLNAPVNFRCIETVNALMAFAKCVSEMGSGHILDFKEIDLEVLEMSKEARDALARDGAYLNRLESLHKTITLYLWLSYRYEGVFQSQAVAFKTKELVEARITEFLEKLNFVPAAQSARRRQLRRMAERHQKLEERLLGSRVDQEEEQQDAVEQGQGLAGETDEPLIINDLLVDTTTNEAVIPENFVASTVEKDEGLNQSKVDHHESNKDSVGGSA